MHIAITSINVCSFPVAFGLYFPRKEYQENIYVDESVGTPLLRIHALKDSEEEEAHFGICPDIIIQREMHKNHWFQIQENTGLISLNRSLEKDLDKIPVGGSWAASSKLAFFVFLSSQPLQGNECQTVSQYHFYARLSHLAYAKVTLSVINATMSSCRSPALSQLCFADKDLSFQIKENKPAGPFHQLQLPSQQQPCQNISISYKVIADESLPFHYDGSSMSVRVTQSLDRELREKYELLAQCTVREGAKETTQEVPLLVTVLDEDDMPPFLINGTNVAEAVVEFSRKEVFAFLPCPGFYVVRPVPALDGPG
uniref:Uncharacterized protein n=1 Tax=Sphaerodactylus townsendi TaxID=933632 RepID=A0ACB8F807_9SAUR